MASVLKLVMMESHATPDDLTGDKGAAQILHRQLFDAHQPNLLDEDDMHIFGSKPMADPLDLVCCNTCKKPIKASQYAVHAERCSSGKVNPNDSMGTGIDDDCGTKKPPKKGRKIKLTNQKVHIKLKAKSQSENKNIANGFELDNVLANKVQPIGSTIDQRLKSSANNPALTSVPQGHHRDAPVPLATKMYHSQGNYRLRLELGQLYRQSCSEHSGSYSIPNSSQENGLMVSHLSPRDNSSLNVAQKSFVPQTKSMDQLLASTPESCPVIPQQVAASVPNRQATKSQKAEVQVSAVKNEMARSRCSKDAVRHSKNTGNKKAHQQRNGTVDCWCSGSICEELFFSNEKTGPRNDLGLDNLITGSFWSVNS
uniref:SAGA-associated factor 11 n=1 Tax=Oryza nivara TaxID=4536 RepID=A0A0E0FNX3_ORYNI